LPKLAGGLYSRNGVAMAVSRGLARESTPLVPRLFNPPELVLIRVVSNDSKEVSYAED
jgi:predicted MPP superfamily phosphohydrolase